RLWAARDSIAFSAGLYRRRFVSSGAEIRLYSDHRRKFGVGRKTLQLPSNSWSNVFRNIFVVALDV
ncbi:MAG: hypothetical protein OXC63_05675, partial [Aestuariivita sp.]|nr:hypothetical protein [Aestuariivita sp.]MCY4346369.1 hypothetical protein [Aestuariivita sp.]